MKRIKGSGFFKLIAWIVFILSVNIFVVSTAVMIILAEMGVYHESYTSVRNNLLEQVNHNYSVQALAYMGQGREEYFANQYFEYGIIKEEDIEDVNLADPSVYEECNFDPAQSGKVNWIIFGDYVSSNTELVERTDMFGETYYYLDTPYYEDLIGQYAEKIVYDSYSGIIYYVSGEEYYPAKRVQVNFEYNNEPTLFIYEYIFDEQKYMLTEILGQPVDEAEYSYYTHGARIGSRDEIGMLLACEESGGIGSFFDFSQLEEQEYSIFDLGELVLDNVRVIDVLSIAQINAEDLENIKIHQENNYYLNEHYTLMVSSYEVPQQYYVVSKIPESFDSNVENNQYAVANQRLQTAYDLQYIIFVIMGAAALLAILTFVFLMKAAGHKRKEEELVLRFFDKVPFELYAAVVGLLEVWWAMLLEKLIREAGDAVIVLICIAILLIAMESLTVGFLLSISVRVKTKTLWKNTITYRICHVIAEVWRYFIRNIGFVWKAVVGFMVLDGLLMFFAFMLACNSYDPGIFLFVLLFDILIAVVYFMAIVQMNQLQEASKKLAQGNLNYEIDTKKMFWEFKKHAENMNQIGNGISLAVEERMKSEHFKTELITNVSHDIKTPLTSIINYVDLLAKEDLQNENAGEYIEVLQRQSSKLKKLIEDLVEASKASTGNLAVNMETLEAGVFLTQTVGEFEEKFAANGLELIIHKPEEPVYICADGRHLWRVVDNLMNNILKYAQPFTRVYIHLEEFGNQVTLTFRNMSKDPLNLTGEELKERFIRGDKSRNSEGHGLGLAIAQSLMDLMQAELTIHVDGDLFKVILAFAKKES